jgi:hypothetical protein
VILGAVRRLALMYVAVGGITVVLSLGFGAISGAPLTRSIAIGLYLIGAVVLIFGFFVGNRGPWRHEHGEGGWSILPRGIRRATADERKESMSISVLFIALGFGLIILGVLSDSAHNLF